MIENNFVGEQKLIDAAETLKNVMARLTKVLVKAAKVVKQIQTEANPDVAEALLMVRAGVTPEYARLFKAVRELVENDAGLLEDGAPPRPFACTTRHPLLTGPRPEEREAQRTARSNDRASLHSPVQQTPIITNNVNHFLAISEKFSIAGVFDPFSDRWSIKPSFDVFPPPYNPNEPDQPKVALPTLQAPS